MPKRGLKPVFWHKSLEEVSTKWQSSKFGLCLALIGCPFDIKSGDAKFDIKIKNAQQLALFTVGAFLMGQVPKRERAFL